jgi:hypothetical protein
MRGREQMVAGCEARQYRRPNDPTRPAMPSARASTSVSRRQSAGSRRSVAGQEKTSLRAVAAASGSHSTFTACEPFRRAQRRRPAVSQGINKQFAAPFLHKKGWRYQQSSGILCRENAVAHPSRCLKSDQNKPTVATTHGAFGRSTRELCGCHEYCITPSFTLP